MGSGTAENLDGPASVRPLRKEGTALVFARRGGYQPPALEISATVEAARKPSPLGEGAERSEADEVCSGGYTGPPGSYHQRKPQGTPLPINGLMLVLYCKGRRFPTEDSLCKKERAVQTDSAFSSLI